MALYLREPIVSLGKTRSAAKKILIVPNFRPRRDIFAYRIQVIDLFAKACKRPNPGRVNLTLATLVRIAGIALVLNAGIAMYKHLFVKDLNLAPIS